MNYFLSKKNCEKLKEWGCDVKSSRYWGLKLKGYEDKEEFIKEKDEGKYPVIYQYDLRDIICSKEMSKKFFGKEKSYDGDSHERGEEQWRKSGYWEYEHEFHSHMISSYLTDGKKEEAEKYFMKHNIFNK